MSEPLPSPIDMTTMTDGDLASLAENALYEIASRFEPGQSTGDRFTCVLRAIQYVSDLRKEQVWRSAPP